MRPNSNMAAVPCFCDLSQGWDLHECYAVTEKSLGVGGCGTVYLGEASAL